MTIIGMKELRQHASQIAERAQKGEHFTVVKRSKPVFTISPPENENMELETWVNKYIEENRDLLKSLASK